LQLAHHQRKIASHILTQDENGKFPYVTCIISEPKKTGKTSWTASIIAWFLECAPPQTQIIICANSLDQSERLIFNDVAFHFNYTNRARVLRDKIINEDSDSRLYTLSKNYTSAAGNRHALVVFDELWGAVSENDWRRYEELTPIPTISHSLQIISSYAGFYGESELLYDLYLKGVGIEESEGGQGRRIKELDPLPCYKSVGQFTYWNHEGLMPWQTEEYYDSQENILRPNAFLRLHENRWVTSREEFIPIEWWEAAEKHFEQSAEIWMEHPYRDSPVYLAIDAATKRDCTAVMGVTVDTKLGKIILMFHKIWTPLENDPLDLEKTLEPYILDKAKKFNIKDIACDPAHMYQIITRLKNKHLPVREFSQRDVSMIEASQHLYDMLRQDNLWAYPAPDIKEHLRNVMAEYTSRGLRIVKDKSSRRTARKKIDAAVALAMACHRAYQDVGKEMPTSIRIESHFAENSAWHTPRREEPDYIPYALRTDVY